MRTLIRNKFTAVSIIYFCCGCATSRPVHDLPSKQISSPAIKTNKAALPYTNVKVSYYGSSEDGLSSKTASGEPFNPQLLTAAHRTLPFGTKVHLINPQNNISTVVRINDRGPFVSGRDLDISKAAAEKLGITSKGVAVLKMRVEKTE